MSSNNDKKAFFRLFKKGKKKFFFSSFFFIIFTDTHLPSIRLANHRNVFSDARLSVKTYRYFDLKTNGLDFDGMISDLRVIGLSFFASSLFLACFASCSSCIFQFALYPYLFICIYICMYVCFRSHLGRDCC